MIGTFWARMVGALTCMAAVAVGFDAEAARWHRHCRTTTCCEPVCCEPVCCEPVIRETVCCEPVCQPACVTSVTSRPNCCVADSGYRVIRETVVVPARPCCDAWSVTSVRPSETTETIATVKPAAPGTKAVAASLAR